VIPRGVDLRLVCEHFNVSRETIEKMNVYAQLLEKWNKKMNLVSKTSLADSSVRHFGDSLQIWQLRQDFLRWIDIGAGAGFPGMVLAILARGEKHPGEFHFIESDSRKCAFLRSVSRETETPVTVHACRIEDAVLERADVVSARALSPLDQLFAYSSKLMTPNAICLFLKGQNCGNELDEASRKWTFAVEKFASETDENGIVLRVRNLARAK
jgi:16S rRNA (guanine527-N7)-methyltransferase